jgi:YfiH family protein
MIKPDVEAKDQIQILRPDWDIPGVDAGFTLRTGGVSKPPYDSLNLAMHVGDDPDDVRENRRRLVEFAGLPEEPRWLKQVHGNRVVHASEVERDITEADAVWTDQLGQVCAVMVADCVPILLAARDGSCVAAIHAGWRGLAAGVIEETIKALPVAPEALVAEIGPCISAEHYEVGPEVVNEISKIEVPIKFKPIASRNVKIDIAEIGYQCMQNAGLSNVSRPQAGWNYLQFFSHRRDDGGRFVGYIAIAMSSDGF